MKTAAVVLLLVLSFIACNGPSGAPSGIIADQKMETILWQLMQSDEYLNSFTSRDSLKKTSAARMKI